VEIVGQGTHWVQGETIAEFDAGIQVDNLQIVDPMHALAQITVLSTATVGYHTVTMYTDGEIASMSQAFNVVQATPTLLSSSPNNGSQASTFNVQLLGRYTHFCGAPLTSTCPQGATVISYGDGVTVNSVSIEDSTSAIANVTVNPLAFIDQPLACHNLTVTTGTEQVTLANQLCVGPGAAVMTNVDPSASPQSSNPTVTVTGQNTHFTSGLTTASFGSGINTSNVTVNSPTQATVTLAVTASAPGGFHQVTLNTLGESATLAQAFTVGPANATLNQVSPVSAQQGESLTVQIIGQYTHFQQGTTTVTFGEGITLDSPITVQDNQTIDAQITVDSLAYLGARTITVTTGGETASLNHAIIVQPGTPILLSSGPSLGVQQQSVTLTILGQLTQWTQYPPTVSVGPGISVGTPNVSSDTALSVGILISPFAYIGSRDVTVTAGSQVLTLPNAFLVAQGPAAISAVSPASADQGATLDITVTGTNTNFSSGITAASFGSGITANSVSVTDSTHAVVNITTAAFATPGQRDVTLTTQGEIATGSGIFTVIQSTPVMDSVSPNSGAQGATQSVTVNAQFTTFNSSTVFDFGQGIMVNSVTINSATQATVTITISPVTTLGSRNVTATTGF